MLDAEVRERLAEIVREKVANGVPFTAYDITRQLRGEDYWVKHDAARVEVHGLFDTGQMPGFDRCLVSKGGPTPAWQYFPLAPWGGSGMAGAGALPGHRTPSRLRAYGAPSPARAGGTVVVCPDRRATVCIPARLVRQVALRPGDPVLVFVDLAHAQLRVCPSGAGSAPAGHPRFAHARRYTVDRHCNIRITRGTQARAGLHGGRRQIQAQPHALIVW